MSARAAWRLESLGFTRVYRYTAGKADWFAAGLPREGERAALPRLADLARGDVPTCGPEERVGDVAGRVGDAGWNLCVVVNDERVVLGLLRAEALRAPPETPVEQVMEPGPRTYRPDTLPEKPIEYMRRQGVESVLVTTSDGLLLGLFEQPPNTLSST